jgi:hypothetical protein
MNRRPLSVLRIGHDRVSRAAAAAVAFGGRRHNVQDIVATNQDFSQFPRTLSVNVFFRTGQEQIHVRIGRLELANVLGAPLELDLDLLAGQIDQERFGIDDELSLLVCHDVARSAISGQSQHVSCRYKHHNTNTA